MMKYSILVGLLALLSGCKLGSSEQARFYLLTPAEAVETEAAPLEVSVRVAAVQMPKYLRNSPIVTRNGNEVALADFDRWAEPLSDNLALVLSKNLSEMIPAERVARSTWEGPGKVDLLVTVAVLRFDTEGQSSYLQARWNVTTSDAREVVATDHCAFVEPVSGEGYSAIVSAMSLNAEKLSREIADAIRAHAGK